jgi:hypothetical protein
VADTIAARLTGRDPKHFKYRYFHECISLGRRQGMVSSTTLTSHRNPDPEGAQPGGQRPGGRLADRDHGQVRTGAEGGQFTLDAALYCRRA